MDGAIKIVKNKKIFHQVKKMKVIVKKMNHKKNQKKIRMMIKFRKRMKKLMKI